MANYKKYTKGATGHLTKHFERAKDEKGEYISFSNIDIDTQKSHLNYNLAPEHNQMDFIRQRCSEVKCLNRKDVNVMCSWVVTAPKGLDPSEERAFFRHTYDFLEKRYDKENVISSYVHLDEKSPHMHFAFIPIVTDKKKGIKKVSAKEKVTKIDLQSFHSDLEKYLEHTLGHEVGILNNATKEGNKSINTLKRGTAIEKVEQIKQNASKIVFNARNEITLTKDSLIPLKAEYEAYKAYIDQSKKDCDLSVMYPDYAVVTQKGLLKKQEYVTVPKEMWEAKHIAANEVHALKCQREAFEAKIKTFYESTSEKRIQKLTDQLKKSVAINQELLQKATIANNSLKRIKHVFKNNPELERAFLQAEKELKKATLHRMDLER